MEEAYRSEDGLEAFSAALEQFEWLISQTHSPEAALSEHGEIEGIIHRDGMELLRRLLQAHLDWRANQEGKQSRIMGADGVERTHVRVDCERKLMSLFGEATVRRMGYGVWRAWAQQPVSARSRAESSCRAVFAWAFGTR